MGGREQRRVFCGSDTKNADFSCADITAHFRKAAQVPIPRARLECQNSLSIDTYGIYNHTYIALYSLNALHISIYLVSTMGIFNRADTLKKRKEKS